MISKQYLKVFFMICFQSDTTPSYIMGWTDSPAASPAPAGLTPDEAELLADYRLLNPTGRGEAAKRVRELTLIAAYTERERKKATA